MITVVARTIIALVRNTTLYIIRSLRSNMGPSSMKDICDANGKAALPKEAATNASPSEQMLSTTASPIISRIDTTGFAVILEIAFLLIRDCGARGSKIYSKAKRRRSGAR